LRGEEGIPEAPTLLDGCSRSSSGQLARARIEAGRARLMYTCTQWTVCLNFSVICPYFKENIFVEVKFILRNGTTVGW
jgi:hypothetical protein